MNIGKSIRQACLDAEITQIQLADGLGKSKSAIHHMSRQKTAKGQNIKDLADFFNMKVSEFIALGEDK